jgi:hypothetical protein
MLTDEQIAKSSRNFEYYGEYSESGVDVSLIRRMLSMTPIERVRTMERHARDTLQLIEYGRKSRETKLARGRGDSASKSS